jgi:hypothetical protein
MKRLEPERVKKLVKLVFYALQLHSIQIQMVARTPVLEYKTVIKYLSKCIRKMRNRTDSRDWELTRTQVL